MIRFYWIIAKEVLSLLSFGLGIFGLHNWLINALTLTSVQNMQMTHTTTYTMNQSLQFGGVTFQLLALSIAVIVSVFKPWGQRRRPKRSLRDRPAPVRDLAV